MNQHTRYDRQEVAKIVAARLVHAVAARLNEDDISAILAAREAMNAAQAKLHLACEKVMGYVVH